MRILLLLGSIVLVGSALAAQSTPASPSRSFVCPLPGDTLSFLRPGDPGYRDAMQFATTLRRGGFVIRCITRTIHERFMGVQSAAGFHTDKGGVSVVFFPTPDGAEKIITTLNVTSGLYHYVFRTRQAGLLPEQRITTDAPMIFFVRGRWFMITNNPEMEEPLQRMLVNSRIMRSAG